MGRLARRNVTTRFSIDRMIDHYLACYEATAGATAQPAEAR